MLAYVSFHRRHRRKLHSTTPIERLNNDVKRRAGVVGIFPNEASITRLIGAVLFERNDEWQTASRYMMVFRGLRGPTGATVPFTLRPDRQGRE